MASGSSREEWSFSREQLQVTLDLLQLIKKKIVLTNLTYGHRNKAILFISDSCNIITLVHGTRVKCITTEHTVITEWPTWTVMEMLPIQFVFQQQLSTLNLSHNLPPEEHPVLLWKITSPDKKVKSTRARSLLSQRRIDNHWWWSQLLTTSVMLLKSHNGRLPISFDYSQQRTVASEPEDPIDWIDPLLRGHTR